MTIPAWLIWTVVLPFCLNDFLFIAVQENFDRVIAVDYGTRLAVLAIILIAISKKIITKEDLGLIKLGLLPFVTWTFILTVFGVFVDRAIGVSLYPFTKQWSLFDFPIYPNTPARWLDLTFGLTLVAFSEEIVFRGLLLNFLKNMIKSRIVLIPILALIFGVIHWSVGPHSIVNSALWALLPIIVCLRIRSIYPAIVAHFVTDFIVFSFSK